MSLQEIRSAIVVGASGDVGQSIACSLARKGVALSLTHHSTDSILEANPVLQPSTRVKWHRIRVDDSSQVDKVITESEKEFGKIDALVYCVGILKDRPLSLTTDEDWNHVIQANLTGAFYCARAVSRPMMVSNSGRIIFLGSVAGRRPVQGQAAYSASKAGLEALSRVLAVELARYGITCNVVVPGAIESRMVRNVNKKIVQEILTATPLKRFGEPSDVTGIVDYLLSPQSSFVTGQTFVVDGGLSIR